MKNHKKPQQYGINYSPGKVSYPALLEVANEADKLIENIQREIRKLRRIFYCIGIFSIVLSVAVTQRLVLEQYVYDGIMDFIGYILPVMIAADKFLGIDKRLPVMQGALSSLSTARWEIYTDEKFEFTKAGNKPVTRKLAGQLVKRLGDARNNAIEKLDEARLSR